MEEVKKAADEIDGLLSDNEPSVSFVPGFGQSSLDFTIACQIGEVTDQYAVQQRRHRDSISPENGPPQRCEATDLNLIYLELTEARKNGLNEKGSGEGENCERGGG